MKLRVTPARVYYSKPRVLMALVAVCVTVYFIARFIVES
jgi:hypothetical protein